MMIIQSGYEFPVEEEEVVMEWLTQEMNHALDKITVLKDGVRVPYRIKIEKENE